MYVILIMRVRQVSNQGSKSLTKLKAKSNCIRKFEYESVTLSLVGIYINLRRQAIVFFKKKFQVLYKEQHGSIHPIISHSSIT